MRTFRTTTTIAALVLLAGCGPQNDTVTTVPEDPPSSTSETSEPAPATELVITTSDGGNNSQGSHRLTCDPEGGDHPDPAAACAALEEAGGAEALAAPRKDERCTMQFGGPETASVTGVVDGEQVEATFARTNGCEIGRWEALEPLLVLTAGS